METKNVEVLFNLEKKRKMRILNSQSHSAEIHKGGDPLGFLGLSFAAKHQKKLEGGTLRMQKNESRTVRKNPS